MLARLSAKLQQLTFGTRLLLACSGIYCAAILLFMLAVYNQWSSTIEQQADAIGQTILQQTANEAVIALAAEDTLGLNILLRELNNNPYINYSVLYSPDNRIIADAGKASEPGRQSRTYSQQLSFQRVLAGNLQIQLDIRQLQQPMYKSLQSIVLMAVLILLLSLLLLHYSINRLRSKMRELNNWLQQPTSTVPHQHSHDEIGQLARSLHQLLGPPLLQEVVSSPQPATREQPATEARDSQDTAQATTEPEPGPEAEETPDSPPAADKAIALAVQLGFEQSFGRLDQARQQQLHEQYQQAVRNCARLYQAQLLELPDRACAMIFEDSNRHYVRYAICAGELLRAFAHQLQMEVADSCCTVSMQLGLAHGLYAQQQELIDKAVSLSSYSRNLLLLCDELSSNPGSLSCARLRSIARPANANCVEQLLTPYLSQLDHQLQSLKDQQP